MMINVLGVPSSVGAYCVGVENAPAALREAGLIDALIASGRDTGDHGDLTTRLWVPDRDNRYAQNLGVEIEAMTELAEAASQLLRAGERLLVLGGSCTVALGLCAGMAGVDVRPRAIYIDRHLDLNTPESTAEGSLSWMGMAHALGLDGAARELADATGKAPLLRSSDLVYLGVELAQTTEWEQSQVDALGLRIVEQDRLCEDPRAAACAALRHLGPGPFIVHLDVDVLDFLDAPVAENVNGRNRGPTIEQLGLALGGLVQNPDCWGMSLGQLDPAHAAADPAALPRLVAVLASSLAQAR
ncbi:arginase family protein [Nesterenkonia halotolerans]|uniref:arginase family protein n=1 Tax=Nesterenkonia halotolerans TaxID=225325 RepID=UPI003EE7B78E